VITLWAVDREGRALAGGDALGERGKPAEAVGREAAQKLRHTLSTEATVDIHLADNLIPLLALVGGQIRTVGISDHIRANMYVCERFLDVRFKVDQSAALIGVER
jgi:RNA 3'-terminal phosphate cyclase